MKPEKAMACKQILQESFGKQNPAGTDAAPTMWASEVPISALERSKVNEYSQLTSLSRLSNLSP